MDHEWARKLGLVSFAGYKLQDASGKPIGVLALFSKQPITAQEDTLLEGLSDTTTQVIQSVKQEEALKLERDRFMGILDSMEDGVVIVNQAYEIEYTNPALEKEFGREGKGLKCYKYFLNSKEACPWCRMQEVLAGKTVRWEWNYSENNKTYEKFGTPLRNPDGSTSMLGIFHDVTERKQAENALRYFERIASSSTDNMAIFDKRFIYLAANTAYLKAFNKTHDELIGNTTVNVFGEDFFNSFIKPNADRCMAGKKINYQAWFNYPTSGERYMDINYYPYIGVDNKIEGFVVNARDITERRKAENLQQLTQFAIDNSANSVYWVRADGSIAYANNAACQSLGYTLDELTSMSVPKIDPGFPADAWPTHWQEMKEANSMSFEAHHRTKTGRVFPVEIYTNFLVYDGEEYIWAYVHDITKRKLAERKVEESLKEKEALLQEIHHRVKNNMQVISSLLNLQAKYIKDKSITDVFGTSCNRIQAMALIHDKLYRSKNIEKIDFKNYISKLVHDLVNFYDINANKIDLKFDVENVSFGIDTAIPCGLVINELVSNSLKHGFPDSKEGEIKISLHLKDQDEYELKVSDNGINFPKDLDYRNSETLGLRLVTSIVEHQLEGKIELNKSEGTGFRVTFKEVKQK